MISLTTTPKHNLSMLEYSIQIKGEDCQMSKKFLEYDQPLTMNHDDVLLQKQVEALIVEFNQPYDTIVIKAKLIWWLNLLELLDIVEDFFICEQLSIFEKVNCFLVWESPYSFYGPCFFIDFTQDGLS